MELFEQINSNMAQNFHKAQELFDNGQYANALAYYFRALNAAEILEDNSEQAKAKKGIMFCYAYEREYDQVLTFSDDLLTNYKLASEQRELTLGAKAFAFAVKGQFRSAEKLLKDLLFSDSPRVRFRAHTDLGLLYYFLHRFSEKESLDLAFENLQIAYNYAVASGEAKPRYKASSNMGLICLEKGEVNEALKFFDESLVYAGNDYYKTQTYNELGRVYAMMGDLEKSEDFFEKAARYSMEHGKFLILTFNIYYRGLVQLSLGKINNAYNYLHTALYSFLEHKHYPEVVAIYKELSSIFEESHPQRAEYFLNEYHHYLNYIDPLGE